MRKNRSKKMMPSNVIIADRMVKIPSPMVLTVANKRMVQNQKHRSVVFSCNAIRCRWDSQPPSFQNQRQQGIKWHVSRRINTYSFLCRINNIILGRPRYHLSFHSIIFGGCENELADHHQSSSSSILIDEINTTKC